MRTIAKALIYDEEGNVLVLQRSSTHIHFPSEADLPGGVVENDEAPVYGLMREIAEETGLMVHPDTIKKVHEVVTEQQKALQVYECHLDTVKPAIKISWEHELFGWVTKPDLLDHLKTSDYFMCVVREYLTTKANK